MRREEEGERERERERTSAICLSFRTSVEKKLKVIIFFFFPLIAFFSNGRRQHFFGRSARLWR